MNKSFIAISLILTSAITSNANADPKTPGTQKGYSSVDLLTMGIPSDLHTVSVDDLATEDNKSFLLEVMHTFRINNFGIKLIAVGIRLVNQKQLQIS